MLTKRLLMIACGMLITGCTIGQSNNQTIEQSNNRTIQQSNNRTIEQSNNRTIEQPNNRTIEQSNNRTIKQSNNSRQWQPAGQRKLKAVLWGVVHNHARGKWDALHRLTNDYEVVGWVDDSASKAMRMAEPNLKYYSKFRKLTPDEVLNQIKPDLIVVEVSNSELVEVSTKIAEAGYPMHMDKPLGTELAGFQKMSDICRSRNIPLQTGYMFRANEAIQFVCKQAHDGLIGEVFSIKADLNHSYGGKKYPEYCGSYPGGTAYLLACHVIEYVMPIFDDRMPDKVYTFIRPAPGDPEGTPSHTLNVLEWPRATCTIEVCSKGTQPCRALRIDGTDGTMEIEPIEDFTKVKHTTGLNGEKTLAVKKLTVKLTLKKAKGTYKQGVNYIDFPAPADRYEGQLAELAKIIRGEIPNPTALYDHDLVVHKVSLKACGLP